MRNCLKEILGYKRLLTCYAADQVLCFSAFFATGLSLSHVGQFFMFQAFTIPASTAAELLWKSPAPLGGNGMPPALHQQQTILPSNISSVALCLLDVDLYKNFW